MKCPNCKSENREELNFCEECGARLEIECPSCKSKIPLGKNFCGHCGSDLSTAATRSLTDKIDISDKETADRILDQPVGAKSLLGQVKFDLGLLHHAKKRRDLARPYISEAIQLFEECRADGFLEKARATLSNLS